MYALFENLLDKSARTASMLVLAAAALILPIAAEATTVVTFSWVPVSENPASAQSTTATGTLQLTLPSFALTGPSTPPNFGPYYSGPTGTAATGDITALSYTSADGLSVTLANVTSRSLQSVTWLTSGIDTPATGAQAPTAPTAGYYLVSGFVLNGTTSQGSAFKIANNLGTAGAVYANGIGNGTNTFNVAGLTPAIADGGYWKLASVAEVPLPAALPLLLSGLGGLGVFRRRRSKLIPA